MDDTPIYPPEAGHVDLRDCDIGWGYVNARGIRCEDGSSVEWTQPSS